MKSSNLIPISTKTVQEWPRVGIGGGEKSPERADLNFKQAVINPTRSTAGRSDLGDVRGGRFDSNGRGRGERQGGFQDGRQGQQKQHAS